MNVQLELANLFELELIVLILFSENSFSFVLCGSYMGFPMGLWILKKIEISLLFVASVVFLLPFL